MDGTLYIDLLSVKCALITFLQVAGQASIHSNLYYEGKEFETRLKSKKRGDLFDELRMALGMPTGLVCWRMV